VGVALKGLVLSGGRGTRLRPLTYTNAKQLVPVANKPVLFYGLEAMREAGIEEVGIVVGDTKAEIEQAVGDGGQWGLRVTYIHQPEPLGIAHAVAISEPFIGKDPFVVYLGDNLLRDGIAELVDEFRRRKPNSQIMLARVPNPQQFGVAELDGDRVVRLEEKPKKPKSDLALVGVYMFDSTIFEAVKHIRPSWRNELEITDAIQYLIEHGYEVESHIIDGWWKDTGKLEDILEANRIILDTFEERIEGTVDESSTVEFKVVVEAGAEIRGSTVRGPAIIGSGAIIENSYVGPFTSIGQDVRILNSEIEHSIVLAGSIIENIPARIADSLIGKDVVVAKSPVKPKVYRFMLGDASRVGIL
jgi:glucose-1-phosphate thymidylyltransferase